MSRHPPPKAPTGPRSGLQTGAAGSVPMEMTGREVIFEYLGYGDYMQVRAVDVATGIEVAVTTPAGAARHDQDRLALRKLARVLGERFPRMPGRGLIV